MTEKLRSILRRSPLLRGLAIIAVIFVVLELVRFVVPQFRLSNPPVTQQIVWNTDETEELWRQACADCHSNETDYPWYAYLPISGWIVAKDVNEGRSALNVSEDANANWDEMVEQIHQRGMPLSIYLNLHPEAKLTDAQRETLMNGILATFR